MVETLRELRVVIVELSPTPTQHSLSRPEQVVGQAEARSIVKRPIREAGQRHATILLVEIKATAHLAGVEGGIPYGKANPLPVVPRAKMRRAKAIVNGQSLGHPPTVHTEELDSVVALVVKVAEVRLLVLTGEASEQVRVRITTAATGPPSFDKGAVRTRAVGLVVDHELIVAAELHGVRAPDLGYSVTHRWQVLLGKQTPTPAGLEATWV